MPEYGDDEAFSRKESGYTRIGDGVRAVDLTIESRLPVDMALLNKLDEVLVELRKNNKYLSDLANTIY